MKKKAISLKTTVISGLGKKRNLGRLQRRGVASWATTTGGSTFREVKCWVASTSGTEIQ